MGEVGMGVDNILSLRVVLASGDLVTVSKTSQPDLFWAMRGAGPNFGKKLYARTARETYTDIVPAPSQVS
jgi:FAD/FMN-containing dehydrogenase